MLCTIKQIRQIEQRAQASTVPGTLMQAAGQSATQVALKLLNKPEQSILVFAGPGNNGGDALEAAVHLSNAKHQVVVLYHPPKSTMSPDSQCAYDLAKACPELTWLAPNASIENDYALVIDGLFGIGFGVGNQQPLSPLLQKQIEQINALRYHRCPILALDVPSGLDADTGNLLSSVAIQASHTITFIADKPGLHTGNGRDFAGIVEVADLGIDRKFFPAASMELNRIDLFSNLFHPRLYNSNKGNYGTVAIVGGAPGMQGAVILAARAALYTGAGRVKAGFIESPPAFDVVQPEIMCHLAEQLSLENATAVVIGPGLGHAHASINRVHQALQSAPALVMDADALNLMGQHPELLTLCQGRKAYSTLLTPHPLEAARLLNCSLAEVQLDRIAAAKNLAQKYDAHIILKGSGSVLAHSEGHIVINPTGNPALATAGTGDVLAGICGALAAQYHDLWQVALAAAWLHGAAADNLITQGIGPVGLCAGELLEEVRRIINGNNYPIWQ